MGGPRWAGPCDAETPGSCTDQMRAQKHGDDGIEEEVNFSVQNSSSRCQIGIDVKHHSLKIVSSTKNGFEI